MADKKITDLQLRSAFSETCNFPVDDTTQTYRVTGQQVLDWLQQKLMPSGTIVSFAGATAPTGFKICDGSELVRVDYPNLFNAIGTTWDTCRNQLTGLNYAAPTADKFRIPDLRGTFQRGVGQSSGYPAVTLGATQDDATNKNGLTLAGSAPSLTGTTSFASTTHRHDITHFHQWAATAGANGDSIQTRTQNSTGWTRNSGYYDGVSGAVPADNVFIGGNSNYGGGSFSGQGQGENNKSRRFYTTGALSDFTTSVTNSGQPNETASVGIANGLFTINDGDAETRPVNVGVNFIIKL